MVHSSQSLHGCLVCRRSAVVAVEHTCNEDNRTWSGRWRESTDICTQHACCVVPRDSTAKIYKRTHSFLEYAQAVYTSKDKYNYQMCNLRLCLVCAHQAHQQGFSAQCLQLVVHPPPPEQETVTDQPSLPKGCV